MKAVIAAGGKGERLSSVVKDIPKGLVKIGGKPILEHQILHLKEHGITDIVILLGYLGDQIKNYFGNGKKWGVNINYSEEQTPLGRTGALLLMQNQLKEDFLFLSGDILMGFDVAKFIRWHKQKKNGLASLVVQPTDHPFDSDLVEVNPENKINSLLMKPHAPEKYFNNLAIASVSMFSPAVFNYIPKNQKSDFEKDVLPLMLQSKEAVYAYNTPEYLRDIGTPDRLELAKADYAAKKVERLHAKNKRKAIFIDRDGVINEWVDYLSQKENFKIYPFVYDAIKKINNSEYLAIVITNQPAVSMGLMTLNDLNEIHKIMETELGSRGAKIDAIYYCPHHFKKAIAQEFKSVCNCRKPKIGLIEKAVQDFNIDLKNSFFIGDSTTDAKTAENASIKFIGVKTGLSLKDAKYNPKIKFQIHKNLLLAVKSLLS